jgi:putative ABC transport system substrate-binding protein
MVGRGARSSPKFRWSGISAVGRGSPTLFRMAPFQQGLKEAGYVENRDVAFEYRWPENHNDRLPALAVDLAARHVVVIVALGSLFAVRAAEAATTRFRSFSR